MFDKRIRKRIVFITGMIFLILAGLWAIATFCFPDWAFADSNYSTKSGYMGINVEHIMPSPGTDGSGAANSRLYGGLGAILRNITTVILLPLGLVFVSWRMIYLACFPMMMHLDPLHMLDSPRYAANNASNSGYAGTMGQKKSKLGSLGSIYENKGGGNMLNKSDQIIGQDSVHGGNLGLKDRDYGRVAMASAGAGSKGNEAVTRCMRIELRSLIRGVIIVALLWTIINVVILAVGMFLKVGDEISESFS